jgi:hypothetical protein
VVGVPLMVITPPTQWADTPAGKPLAPGTLSLAIPVAPVVEYVMLVIAVLTHSVCASVPATELNVAVLAGVTVMVPVALTDPHPPVNNML